MFETVTDFAISSVLEQGLIAADFNPILEGGGKLFDGIGGLSDIGNWANMGGGFLGGYGPSGRGY